MKKIFLVGLYFLFSFVFVQAQSTRVRGLVTDAESGEPLPFATVAFLNTPISITTGFDGIYALETREQVKEIGVLLSGYFSETRPVTTGSFQNMNFALKPQTIDVDEVVVLSSDEYERSIIAKVVANKEKNDPLRIPELKCNIYTKMELDLSNVENSLKNKHLQKNFGFVFNYVDTSAVTGNSFLPIMISESSSRYYQRNDPPFTREIIEASRISGIEDNSSFAQFTGNLYVTVNLYENYLDLFNIKFASPLSAHGDLFYKYYLIDSLEVEGRKTYTIRFHPKSFSTPVLDGEIQIDATDYALRSAHVKMVKGININWIRNLSIDCENILVDDRYWHKKQEKIFADFSVVMNDSSKMMSFLGHRQVDYSNVEIGKVIPEELLSSDTRVLVNDSVYHRDESYWQSARPYELSSREQNIYLMVDSIKNVPLYHNIYTVISTILGGYYEIGKFAIGPYYKILSFNRLEGVRFQFGGRTTAELHKKIRFSAYAAYGTKDKEWKGSGGIEYVLQKQPRRKIEVSAKHDVVQLGLSEDALTEGNIVSSLLSRGNMTRLSIINRADLFYTHEWSHGLNGKYGIRLQEVYASPYVDLYKPDSSAVHKVQSAALNLEHRISWNEIVTYGNFGKYYQYTNSPVITTRIVIGNKNILPESYDYYRLEGSVLYNLKIPPIGTSHIILEGGKIFGKVPYPLLKLHEGNGTYFYDERAFSCMNYYEFASDAWVSLLWEHDFKGFFLGKIPLLKRLQWREAVSFKGVYGSISKENDGSLDNTEAILQFPQGMSSVSTPYLEAGIGIKNILRVFRVDAFWRLTHRESISTESFQKFTINVGAELNF